MLPSLRRVPLLDCSRTLQCPLRASNISYFCRAQQPNISPVQRTHCEPPNRLSSIVNPGRRFSYFSPPNIRRTYFPPSNQRSAGFGGGGRGFFDSAKQRFNSLPPSVIIWGILGLNGVVYILWNVGINSAKVGDPTLLISLHKNFTLSWKNWKEGRIWTLLTSCFSHEAHHHILFNAFTFYFMAPPVLQLLGNVSFLTLYIGGGIVSSVVTLFTNQTVFRKDYSVRGASGAIYAVISFMACVAPTSTFLIFGIIPVPAWGCVVGLFAYDLYNAVNERDTGTSQISHIAGILSGIAYFLRITGRLPRL